MKSLALGFLGGILSIVLLGAVQKTDQPVEEIIVKQLVVSSGSTRHHEKILLHTKTGIPQLIFVDPFGVKRLSLQVMHGRRQSYPSIAFFDDRGQSVFTVGVNKDGNPEIIAPETTIVKGGEIKKEPYIRSR